MAERLLDPALILRALHSHAVDFVVIGGLAATLHGSPHVTFDIDITPDLARPNLDRLSDALRDLDARIRVAGIDDGVPFDHTGESLSRAGVWNLTTRFGDLDISFVPGGTDGWEDLKVHAIALDLVGGDTLVASLADLIRSKTAANRPKDHVTLPTLRELLRRQQATPSSSDDGELPGR